MSHRFLIGMSLLGLVLNFASFQDLSAQSSHCFIQTSDPFKLNSQPRLSSENNSRKYYDRISWNGFGQLDLVDEKCTEVFLAAGMKSEALELSGFNFDIPENAIVTGVSARIFGSKKETGIVRDLNVRLLDSEGRITGINKANKTVKGNPFNQRASVFNYWEYGTAWDDWGVALSPQLVNDPDFGISIEIFNNSQSPAQLLIDQLILTIHYEAPYRLCSEGYYLSLHTEPNSNVTEYNWQVPQSLNFDPVENHPYLISILETNSVFGNYEICLERIYSSGMSDYCCTQFEFINCDRSSIGDYVWHDVNGNGLQDPGEEGLHDRRIYLYNESMELLSQEITDHGHYSFTDLEPGYYFIKVEIPEMLAIAGSGSNEALDSDFFEFMGEKMSGIIHLSAGEHIDNVDFGLGSKPGISGVSWLDKNANGVFESADELLPQVLVRLYDGQDRLVNTATSSNEGEFQFDALEPGNYRLEFLPGGNFKSSPSAQDNDLVQGELNLLTELLPGKQAYVYAAFYRTAGITGLVWLDLDGNGFPDTDDEKIAGTEILLYDCNQQLKASSITASDGSYLFEDLTPGEYSLCVNNTRSDIYIPKEIECTDCFNLSENSLLDHQDFVFSKDVQTIELRLYTDYNANDSEDTNDEIPDLSYQVRLEDCDSGDIVREGLTNNSGLVVFDGLDAGVYALAVKTGENYILNDELSHSKSGSYTVIECINLENANDLYLKSGLLKLPAIGDLAWHDKNRNGIQDVMEMGIESIRLSICDEQGSVISEVSTDKDGLYHFEGLLPGNYFLRVSDLESMFELTDLQTASSEINSDFYIDSQGTARTELFNLDYFDNRTDMDLGLVLAEAMMRYSISGNIWQDGNGDQLNQLEVGLPSVRILLYSCSGQLIAETQTDSSGNYSFDFLEDGEYFVNFDVPSNFLARTDLGQTNIELNESGNSDCFIVDSSDVILNAAYLPMSELGDRVWLDEMVNGQQDDFEEGVEGLRIQLLDTDDIIIEETLTGPDGLYQFKEVLPGTYRLELPGVTDIYIPTLQAIGDDMTDSDLRFENNRYISEWFELYDGVNRTDIDLGINFHSSVLGGTVFIDDNEDGIRNGVEQGFGKLEIQLFESGGQLVQSTEADADGIYRFYGLLPGEYYLEFELPDGYAFSPAEQGQDELFDSDVICCEGRTDIISITGSDIIEGINAGLTREHACVEGLVWLDSNEDGIYDQGVGGVTSGDTDNLKNASGEAVLEGINVSLYDSSNNLINQARTGTDGSYRFCNLEAGQYYVQFELLPGHVFTLSDIGLEERFDSDVIFPDGRSGLFELQLGEVLKGMNAGMHEDMQMPLIDTGEKYTEVMEFTAYPGGNASAELIAVEEAREVGSDLKETDNYKVRSIIDRVDNNKPTARLYPNPTSGDEIHIDMRESAVTEPFEVRIFDSSGRLHARYTHKELSKQRDAAVIFISGWKQGSYLLQITDNSRTENHRFVIIRP